MNSKTDMYKVIFTIISLVSLFGIYIYAQAIDFNGCGNSLFCHRRLFTSGIISVWSFPFLSVFISSLTFYFVKFITDRFVVKYYLICIPIMTFFIVSTPMRASGGWGLSSPNREDVAFGLSILFVLVSWLIAFWGFVKGRK